MLPTGPNHTEDHELDLLQLLKPLRTRWKRFLLLWLAFTLLGAAFVATRRPEFQSTGALYVEETVDAPDSAMISALMPMLAGSTNLESESELLRSRDLARKVIRKLGLNASLTGPAAHLPRRPRFWQWYLDRDPKQFNRGLHVRDTLMRNGAFTEVEYDIAFTDAQHFTVSGDGTDGIAGALGEPVTTPDGEFVLQNYGGTTLEAGTAFTLTLEPAEAVRQSFAKKLAVQGGGPMSRSGNVIYLTFTADSPYLGVQVVETLFDEFVNLKLLWATSVSRKTLEFITGQIEELKAEMNNAAARLSAFQSETGLVSLDPQVKAELDSMVGFEVQLRQQQMRLRELEQLAESLTTDQPDFYLMAFIGDPLIQEMGKRLAELNGEIASLESQFQGDYPQLQQLRTSRQSLQQDLQGMVVNYLDRARNRQQELAGTVQQYRDRMSTLPEQAMALTDFLRSTKVFEDLYLLLSQEKQRARIAEASTLSNLRVVDRPEIPLKQSSPNPLMAVVITWAVGLIASALAVIIPALRTRWFTTVDEVRAHFTTPIFTVIPHQGREVGRASPDMLETQSQSPYIESIRLLRANLMHTMAGKKRQTILVTSAMPKDGKTSVAANLAATMAKSERVERVLLIDADMHNPTMHRVFSRPQSPGLSEFLNGDAAIEEIIQQIPLDNGGQIDLVVAGPIPPTPVDLIETDAMQALIDYAKNHYTFTIIDSPPYPLTTTATILATKVDRILAVCRIGSTHRAIFKRHVEDLSKLTKQFGLIVNTDQTVSEYGYEYGGYGYGNNRGKGGSNGNGAGNGEIHTKPRSIRQLWTKAS